MAPATDAAPGEPPGAVSFRGRPRSGPGREVGLRESAMRRAPNYAAAPPRPHATRFPRPPRDRPLRGSAARLFRACPANDGGSSLPQSARIRIVLRDASGPSPLCPGLRCVPADAPTDANGVTWITLAGADPATPGAAQRNPNREWGHYDSDIPVYALRVRLKGRLDDGRRPARTPSASRAPTPRPRRSGRTSRTPGRG